MKKYIIFMFFFLLLIGCEGNTKITSENIDSNNTTEVLPETPPYIDENPVVVGLYQNGKLLHTINTNINPKEEIASVDIYFTNEENVYSTNTKKNFTKYASHYEDITKYKIGFQVSFSTEEETINKLITGPKDMYILAPYIYNYLYDDVHQSDNAWYSHLEEKDINENTVYSSIKLYAASEASKINSPITLMVFTYDTEDDFDDNGIYRGNSKYIITIKE